ncbi:hypothetical protein F5876DRAFT_79401 [Lentinula aff. lateritia]|uniref:Uncharacterized protein n=1 Tax=Lentinula aff. lateritia TaxID=2804960 RepID=A0ACC1TSN8_9AGAR|nr:hypothetical protein F5876DRAFT_79401 [Lentinula aff. lateritia]
MNALQNKPSDNMEVDSNPMPTPTPGTLDEVLTQAGFPSHIDPSVMASNDYLATLCIACGIDLTHLEHGKKLDRDNTLAKTSGQLHKKSAGVAEHKTTESMQQVVALDRFIRALKYSGEPQTVRTNLGCLKVTRSELRNSRAYILKIEDEIAEGRKYCTQSIIRNQRHSYMIDELRLQVSESYAEAEIQSRQEQLKLLKRIEELELRLSKDEWMKQAKRIEELEIQVAREKLVRGKAAHILHNNHDPFAAKDEALMLLKPALVTKLPPSLRYDLRPTTENFHQARERLFRKQIAHELLSQEDTSK